MQAAVMALLTFREVQDPVGELLRKHGALSALVVDCSQLARIERGFGATAYQMVRDQITSLLGEAKGHVRDEDILARDEAEGDRFIVFLAGPRKEDNGFSTEDLRRLADRVEEFLNPRVGRMTLPYLRERPSVSVGYGVVLYSPLVREERLILRVIEDAMT